MKQYCRYCANAVAADLIGIWCEAKKKEYSASTAKAENHCTDFIYCDIDAFYCGDDSKRYKPRIPKQEQCEGQISLF
ncbi:hypothetical protein I5677_12185 [Mobilitalea sibirica]|uniref:Uncharacterized protein n=1 Tax=Mobilitalea sibirica TaxID=1462919 RepID=A0A8J7KXD0_9FIRM|nr:hypothetical protein [Mobilitalea sibirica]MBH1941652.1 hypothetical protein [Mobilitalea sibirica]